MRFETLEEIGNRSRTDKQRHGYLELYDNLFFTFRFRPIRLFEIGFFKGASAKAFAEYFPYSLIHVLDHSSHATNYLNNFPEVIRERIILHKGDQGSREDIRRVLKDIAESPKNPDKRGPREFQVIVDDGSHQPEHQIISFEELWPSVSLGGYYIIEDLHISYQLGNGCSKTIDYFMDKVHYINNNRDKEKRGNTDIESVSFPRNLIVIKKKKY